MGKAKIMVVEDEGMFAVSLRMKLTSMGYDVCKICNSGEDAVAQVIAEQPDFVVMDVGLAGKMDGIETAKAFLPSHAVPILFLTGYSKSEILDQIKDVEFAEVMTKPVKTAEIAEFIRKALITSSIK